MRLVLTWGPNPSDFDSEVKFFDEYGNVVCRTYYADKTSCVDEYGATYMHLDVDETSVRRNFQIITLQVPFKILTFLTQYQITHFQGGTNGPETISITNVPVGYTAMYYIYDYSQQCGNGYMSFSDSEGQATIYGPNGSGWFFSFN